MRPPTEGSPAATERERALTIEAARWERDWHRAQSQIEEHARIQVELSDALNKAEEALREIATYPQPSDGRRLREIARKALS